MKAPASETSISEAVWLCQTTLASAHPSIYPLHPNLLLYRFDPLAFHITQPLPSFATLRAHRLANIWA